MAHALPLAKLGGLLVKSLAKPLSKRIKHEFSRYPFTQNILVSVGQGTHHLSSRMTIWSAGYTVRHIKPLEEEAALKQGAEFVGESFILIVSMGVLLYEYNQASIKSAAKERQVQELHQSERDELQAKLHALHVRVQALESVVKHNSSSIINIMGAKYKAPDKKELVPIDDTDDDDANEGTSSEDSQQQASWWSWRPWK